MSIKKILFKPKWQSKDVAQRAEAVANDPDPELMAALPVICVDDESSEVRVAAIRRVNALSVLARAQAGADTAAERDLIGARIRALTTSRGRDRPPLEDRLSIVRSTADRELLDTVALQGPETELRRAAIERVDHQGPLGDAAIDDSDADNRRAAAARITQHSTLKRVIEALRKSDKALHHELQQRLHRERLAAGEPDAVNTEARALCEQLEALALAPEAERRAGLPALEQAWASLGEGVEEALRQRHAGVLARLQPPPADAATPPPKPEPKPEEASAQDRNDDADADTPEPSAETPPEAEAPETNKEHNRPPGPDLASLEAQVELLLRQVEDGELHLALETRAAILETAKQLGKDPRWKPLQRRVASVHGRLREMRDWLHWSNNKIRKRLIREMQELPASGLHPDAVLEKLKALQAQWKELERSEQIPGEKHFSTPSWMWRQFNAAGRKAFELTKPFLDKRTEVQQGVIEEARALRDRLRDLSQADEPDWVALRQALIAVGRRLQEMRAMPSKARRRIEGGLRKAADGARARLDDYHQEVEKAKRKLIRAAQQLAHVEDRAEAIAQAKSLQAEWKAAGTLWRKQDQALWREFREPIDPLFEAVKTEQKAVRAEQAQARTEQEALCAQLAELLQGDPGELAASQGKVQGLRDAWQALPRADNKLRQRFLQQLKDFDQRLREAAAQDAAATRQRWWDKAERLHHLELTLAKGKKITAKAGKDWPGAKVGGEAGSDIDQALDARWRAALEGANRPEADPEVAQAARMLAIRLEFLAGLPSPEADRELRMNYQVDRLSATMAGEQERVPARKEALEAEQEWLLLSLLEEADYAQYGERIKTALDEVNKE